MYQPTVILILVGVGFLVIAIVGGGVEVDHIKISGRLPLWARIVSGLFGLAFLGLGVCMQFPSLCPPCQNNCDQVIYEDTVPGMSSHGIELLALTAKSCNPPHINNRLFVEFTLRNTNNQPVNILGVWVTAYDPSGMQKDFAYLKIDTTIMPQEKIKTSGERALDVAGTWSIGPHYALGTNWNNAQYPGGWKRFQIKVEP